MENKLNLDNKTTSKLKSILKALKANNGGSLSEIAPALNTAGITADKAIAILEKKEPQDFYFLYKKYHQHKTIEWYPVFQHMDIEFLASMMAHEAKKITQKKKTNDPSYYPFIIAGLERLINYQKAMRIKFPSMIVIFDSLFTSFKLSQELAELDFLIGGVPYFPPRTPADRAAMKEIKTYCYGLFDKAIEGGYAIITIDNNPLALEILQELRNKKETPNAADWLFLAFFHNLKELVDNKVQLSDTDYLDPFIILRENRKEYDSFNNFPFVKKVNISHHYKITEKYLQSLFDINN
jgi:hypothetical protein